MHGSTGGNNLLDVLDDQAQVAGNWPNGVSETERGSGGTGVPSTMTMRLRKPRKLGVSVVSWLRQEGLDSEWMASTWRYFLRNAFLN